MVSNAVDPDPADDSGDGCLTETDVLLGKKATKFVSLVCACALLSCIAIATFVFMNVPWDTRMPYDGKYSRGGGGIPMQIAMFPLLVPILGFWKVARNPEAHRMDKGGRARAYFLVTAFVLACVVGQWIMGKSILIEGGFLAG